MNPQRLRGRKQPRHKTVLHQWLATAQSEATKHQLQTVTIFSQRFDRPLERDRDAVHHVPGVGIVTVETTELTTRGPGNDPHSWSIDRRTRGERMEEAH